MKKTIAILAALAGAGLTAGTLTFDDGRVVEGEIQKIAKGDVVYLNGEKKLVTVSLAKLSSYSKETIAEQIPDDPKEYADYTLAHLDLKMPISAIGGTASTDKNAKAEIKFSVNRKRNPEVKTMPAKIRHPYIMLYIASVKKDKTEVEYARFTYPRSFRPKDFALDDAERLKVLRDKKRETYDFDKATKESLGSLDNINEINVELPFASKFKDAAIKAYRLEIWGNAADAPLNVKEWSNVGFTPERNWWYNAKR